MAVIEVEGVGFVITCNVKQFEGTSVVNIDPCL